eukprot:NODE_27841_length_499_cov_0.930108.p3 GENE.NODE_27841_length_499_cov_0.930108~~NODE_27841_length_499_cov_0.930108.p3  ORF type:complete len:117 (+),score=25.34 NODE_27841_length_499_cov_0.930108:123-473(+)
MPGTHSCWTSDSESSTGVAVGMVGVKHLYFCETVLAPLRVGVEGPEHAEGVGGKTEVLFNILLHTAIAGIPGVCVVPGALPLLLATGLLRALGGEISSAKGSIAWHCMRPAKVQRP